MATAVDERRGAESAISEGQRGLRRHVRGRANDGMIGLSSAQAWRAERAGMSNPEIEAIEKA